MRRIYTLIIFLLISFLSFAQYKPASTSIYGEVSNEGDYLPFINIYIEGTTIGTTSDKDGKLLLSQVPAEGPVKIIAQGVGFKSKSKIIDMSLAEPMELSFDLEEDVLNLEG